MSPADDGGPAFPTRKLVNLGGGASRDEMTGGMTLRDYFAAKALAGLVSTQIALGDALQKMGKKDTELDEFICAMSYRYADAMLKARQA